MTTRRCLIRNATSSAANAVAVADNFITPADCRRLLEEVAGAEWVSSAVTGARGLEHRASGRHSDSLVLSSPSRWVRACIQKVEHRLRARFDIEPKNLEPWQITRYQRSDRYDYHLDCGQWATDPAGDRRQTILIVLEEPTCGGATHFRALDRSIRPVTGRLLVWSNLLPTGDCNHAMIHAARPVWKGRKVILTTWERERPCSR